MPKTLPRDSSGDSSATKAWKLGPTKEVATAINADHLRTKTPEEKEKLEKLQAETAPTPRGCSAPRAREENPDCMSYRQLQMVCMRRQLNPCNGRKAVLLRKVKDAMSTRRTGRSRRA